jgi:hypothetical protein
MKIRKSDNIATEGVLSSLEHIERLRFHSVIWAFGFDSGIRISDFGF